MFFVMKFNYFSAQQGTTTREYPEDILRRRNTAAMINNVIS